MRSSLRQLKLNNMRSLLILAIIATVLILLACFFSPISAADEVFTDADRITITADERELTTSYEWVTVTATVPENECNKCLKYASRVRACLAPCGQGVITY